MTHGLLPDWNVHPEFDGSGKLLDVIRLRAIAQRHSFHKFIQTAFGKVFAVPILVLARIDDSRRDGYVVVQTGDFRGVGDEGCVQ